MKTPIGFWLAGHDNDTEMYTSNDKSLSRCQRCGYRLDFNVYNPEYKFTKSFRPDYLADDEKITRITALTYTYDAQIIVTKSFMDYCVAQNYAGLEFRAFPNDPLHFQLIAKQIVEVNKSPAHTKLGKLCSKCKNFSFVIINDSVNLLQLEVLEDGFYFSDLPFGDGDKKSPLLIIGCETKLKLTAAKFRGLVFEAVYGTEVP